MKQWDFDPLGYHPAVDAGFGVSSISDRRQSPWCMCYDNEAISALLLAFSGILSLQMDARASYGVSGLRTNKRR